MIHKGLINQLDSLEKTTEENASRAIQALCNCADELEAHLDSVGEIPQIKLEQRLSPIMLSVHSQLDRARVMFESAGMVQNAANIWELEQQVYRLLNDL